jgi:hypothetical protein
MEYAVRGTPLHVNGISRRRWRHFEVVARGATTQVGPWGSPVSVSAPQNWRARRISSAVTGDAHHALKKPTEAAGSLLVSTAAPGILHESQVPELHAMWQGPRSTDNAREPTGEELRRCGIDRPIRLPRLWNGSFLLRRGGGAGTPVFLQEAFGTIARRGRIYDRTPFAGGSAVVITEHGH